MKISPPESCPSCGETLTWEKDQLFCRSTFCPAKQDKRIEHFCKTLNIKGLGPKTVQKLELSEPWELYDFTVEELTHLIGSEKLAIKIFDEIKESQKADLQRVLPAFSIPLLGKSASEKISKRVSSIEEITVQTCREAGLGPKVTENLLRWVNSEEWSCYPFSFESAPIEERTITSVVCITGRLKSFKTKNEAKAALEQAGYLVKDSVTKDVEILINESGIDSAKVKKARANGTRIVTSLSDLIIGE